MSFKCSVFGHAYGDSEIERNREEDGSEVVTTIRETQTCKRCGETRVVSENKEVTTLETAADIVADDFDGESDADAEAGMEPEAEDPPDESPTPAPEPPAESTDAEILDAETETAAAPEESEETTAFEASTTTPGTDGFDTPETDPETDDGVILDDGDDDDDIDDREPGEWPDEPADSGADWQPETETDPTSEETTVEPTGSAVTVPDGEFHCPECEFSTAVEESSLRAGDFCPECHRGSLEHASE